eukprot:3217177-Rhodomonas_salina.2
MTLSRSRPYLPTRLLCHLRYRHTVCSYRTFSPSGSNPLLGSYAMSGSNLVYAASSTTGKSAPEIVWRGSLRCYAIGLRAC